MLVEEEGQRAASGPDAPKQDDQGQLEDEMQPPLHVDPELLDGEEAMPEHLSKDLLGSYIAEGRIYPPLFDSFEQNHALETFNRVKQSNQVSMLSPANDDAASRLYMVGKFKDYRKLVGVS